MNSGFFKNKQGQLIEIVDKKARESIGVGDTVGNITDDYELINIVYNSNLSGTKQGESKLYKVKAGDFIYIVGNTLANASSLYNRYILLDNTKAPYSSIANPSTYGMVLINITQDGYVCIPTKIDSFEFTDLKVYKNKFVDIKYIDKMYDDSTLIGITDGMMRGLKGIVTSPNVSIQYEKGYYIAWTNGHEVINFPSIVLKHGDIAYYDGEYFNLISSRGTFALNRNKHYNVVIVGGGASGLATALNLIGSGMKVAIIDKNRNLGGTHTCAGVIELSPSPVDDSLKQVVRDAWEDGYAQFTSSTINFSNSDDKFEQMWSGSHLNFQTGTGTNPTSLGNKVSLDKWYLQQYYYNKLVEGGVDIYLETEITSVVTDGNYIRGCVDKDGNVYHADYFVDASSILIKLAGEEDVDYYYGYDGSSRFGENLCTQSEPNKSQINLITLGKMIYTTKEGLGDIPNLSVPFDKTISQASSGFTMPRVGMGCKYSKSQEWMINHPCQNGNIGGYNLNAPQSYYGVDNMNVDSDFHKEFGDGMTYARYATQAMRQNASGVNIGYVEPHEMLGIREGCRLNALYIGKQSDCQTKLTSLGDKSILSSWYCEHHNLYGITKYQYVTLVGLPIQSMMSAKFKNYLNPSKDKGVSHYAHSTFRLMRTCWLSGRLSAEIIKLVWQTTNDVTGVSASQVNANAGINELFNSLISHA